VSERERIEDFDPRGKTVAAISERAAGEQEDDDVFGTYLSIDFTDGTTWELWSCGCCGGISECALAPERVSR
jgi:hypothetical protein